MSFEEIWEKIKEKKNVVGYSKKFRKRIKDGKKIDEEVIRIYVSKKIDPVDLDLRDLIPREIDGVSTDVIEIGEIKALDLHPLAHVTRVRPLVAGVSIGNWAITAGTLGWFFKDGRGREMLGSNAHVFAEDPLKPSSSEKRIVQPGRYDQGNVPEDIVATYYWHQPLSGSECALSNAITGLLNGASVLLGRKTRFELTLADKAKIDFAVAEPTTDYELKLYTADECEGFIGLGFAGSNQASFFCKAQHIRDTGWTPIGKTIMPVTVGESIHKIGRTTEYTSGQVVDDSAYGRVNYGGLNYVEFDDVILTTAMLEGGDSGDSAWKSITMMN
jgi:hypothetical protein